MAKHFLPYDMGQVLLLPPDMRDWLPREHLVWFISDVVDTALDLSPILAKYAKGDARGCTAPGSLDTTLYLTTPGSQ